MKKYIIILLSLFFMLSACNKKNKKALPGVKGKAYELTLVIDKKNWKDTIGKLIRYTYYEEVEGLPQAEPQFSVTHIPPDAFTSIFRSHRNILNVEINPKKKQGVFLEKDVWAFPQYYVLIRAKSKQDFIKLYKKHEKQIFDFFYNGEQKRLLETFKQYPNKKVIDKIKKEHQISILIPKGYSLDVDSQDFIWISHETQKEMLGVFIYYYPYTDTNTFTPKYLVTKRNEFLKKYVPGPTEGSYMTTETVIPVIFNEYNDSNGKYYAEIKGLWKVENDFMGGPFVSITKLDEKHNRVVTAEGWVYYPSENKRNFIRQLEIICKTLSFSEEN